MSRVTRKTRKLGFQALESRQLMAGDVTVAMYDGLLAIRADNAANGIEVVEVGQGAYSVRGLEHAKATTRINGGTAAFTANGVEEIAINLYSGSDLVKVTGTGFNNRLAGNLTIRAAEGNDSVLVRNMWVEGDLAVYGDRLPAGNDYISMQQVAAGGRIDVTSGAGADTISFTTNGGQFDYNIANGFRIDSGSGTAEGDTVTLNKLFSSMNIDILTSEGSDVVDARTLLAYQGDLTALVSIQTFGGNDQVTLAEGDGYDNWEASGYNTDVMIDTGADHDTVILDNIDVPGMLTVRTWGGDDKLTMTNVDVEENVFADLGSGDDTLHIGSSSAQEFQLFGGLNDSDGDSLTMDGNLYDTIFRAGWE